MNSLIDPNLNADVYRNMTAADRPPVFDKHLQFILIYNEKSAVLGGSNLTDRYWSGTVWYYTDISDFNRDKAFVATKAESGVCDATYLDHDKFVIIEDNGVLQILHLCNSSETNLPELQCAGYACLHDNSPISVSAFSDKNHVVTSGMDCCIKVWDVEELLVTHSFDYAHTDIVTCVDAQPASTSIFASTSLDGEALMWDVRQSKPAQCILSRGTGLTAVHWNPILDNVFAVGTDSGDIMLIDTRKTDSPVLEETCVFPRSIHKLLFNSNPKRSGELAGCCDDTIVKVLDANNKFALIYENNSHTDFVRGLEWFKDELHSCAWDNTVIKHTIRSEEN